MDIYLKDTRTGEKKKFEPIKDGHLSMYNCGPTVYDRSHIGNLRAYVFADLIRRTFEYNGYEVNQIINITDVGHLTSDADLGEDKVEKKAREENKSAKEITEEYAKLFKEDLKSLNIDVNKIDFPKATDHIDEQIKMIEELEEKGLTYKTSDGIYFDTSLFKDYGVLGGIDLEGLKEGARVEKNDEKKNGADFALWKFSNPEENRQQEWESPWGTGFPGWHLECSAMSRKYLGDTFDIHTGGVDHIGTHHNNEIAQTESLTGKEMANFWMHINHITVDGEKMSKSLGNIYSLDDLKEKGFKPENYRYWLLTGNYHTLMNFTFEALEGSKNALDRLVMKLSELPDSGKVDESEIEEFKKKYINNDLLTASLLGQIHGSLLKGEKISNGKIEDADIRATVLDLDKVLGLNLEKLIEGREKFVQEIPEEIKELLEERQNARDNKDFDKSDSIRKEIEEKGYKVHDTEKGQEIEAD